MGEVRKQLVLIGFAESLSAPEVAWSLVDAGFQVAAYSRRGRRPALRHSKFVTIHEITAPESDLGQATADLQKLVKSLRKDSAGPVGLMPLDDESVWLCGRTEFGADGVTLGPKGAAVELALNKKLQLQQAREAGFAVPCSRCLEKTEEVFREKIEYPVVFKPATAVARMENRLQKGRAWICADRQELQAAVHNWAERGPMILQRFVAGVGEGMFGIATENGIIGWSGHRRVRMMNPHGSGSSACASISRIDSELKTAAGRFLSSCDWRGLFMIELLRDDTGKPWFMEFNGRCWGSMALARRAGFEYPAWTAQAVFQPASPVKVSETGNHPIICRHFGREMLHLLFVLRGSKSKALTAFPSFWASLRDMLRFGRNDYWYNWRSGDRAVFFSDTYRTLRDQFLKPKYRA